MFDNIAISPIAISNNPEIRNTLKTNINPVVKNELCTGLVRFLGNTKTDSMMLNEKTGSNNTEKLDINSAIPKSSGESQLVYIGSITNVKSLDPRLPLNIFIVLIINFLVLLTSLMTLYMQK